MSLSRLATVEMQLIMHFLAAPSIVCLARCCHFTLACASEQFAWRFVPPLPIVFQFDEPPWFDARYSHSLLRFGGVTVRWTHTQPVLALQRPPDDAEVDALLNIPHIRVINSTKRRLFAVSLAYLLAHPSLVGIASLELPIMCNADANCAQLLQQCVSLTHLNFDSDSSAVLLTALPQLSGLSSLAVRGNTSMVADHSIYRPIHQCTVLRSLSLVWLQASLAHAILSSNMAHVTSLSLTGVFFTQSVDDLELWKQCLAGLPLLTNLSFQSMAQVDTLLQALSLQVPLLTQLNIAVALQLHERQTELPSDQQIESLLHRPSLKLFVSIRRSGRWKFFGGRSVGGMQIWRAAQDQLSAWVQKHPQRVKLELMYD
jgi:hypothetical protein